MAGRRLGPEEQAAWAQLARTVKPIRRDRPAPPAQPDPGPAAAKPAPAKPIKARAAPLSRPAAAPVQAPPPPRPSDILDGRWEKQIRRGQLMPEMAIDLHGHTLALAHQRLERALVQSLADGVRVLLVVTGKPRENRGGEEGRRGAIRAEIGHWLQSSSMADRIASVRTAHPRHGGTGALYIILRRRK